MKKPPTPIELLHECSRKQQAFILALVSDPTITQREAFRRAGYSAQDAAAADSNASKLLRNDRVKRAYHALKVQTTEKAKHFMLLVEAKRDSSEDWDKWAERLASARQRTAEGVR